MKKSISEAMEQAKTDSVKYFPNKILVVIDYPRRGAKVVTIEEWAFLFGKMGWKKVAEYRNGQRFDSV